MTMRFDRSWLAGLFCLLVATYVVVGPGLARMDAAEPPAAEAEEPAAEPDPFAVPDGGLGELLQFVEDLKRVRPTTFDAAGIAEYRTNVGNSLLEVTDKILAAEPSDAQAAEAVSLKVQGLSILQAGGVEGMTQMIESLPEELEKAGFGKHVRIVEAFLLESKLSGLAAMSEEDMGEIVAAIKAFLSDGTIDRTASDLAMAAPKAVERTDADLAARLYKEFGQILADADDESAQSTGQTMLGAARRMTLLGNQMFLEGTKVDGEKLDWPSYKGKVVLVDFWATWCGPCIGEIPNIRKNYDLYHDRGFDVIGISVDSNRGALDTFLEKNDLPWTIVFDKAMLETDSHPMGTHYGIFGIPTVILVGADGNVVSLGARGEELGRLLEEQIGPAEEK